MNQKIQAVSCHQGAGAKSGQGERNGEGKRQSRAGGAPCVPCFHIPASSLCGGSAWAYAYTQVKFRYFSPPTLFLNVVSSDHILRESWWWFFPLLFLCLHLRLCWWRLDLLFLVNRGKPLGLHTTLYTLWGVSRPCPLPEHCWVAVAGWPSTVL